MIHPHQRRVHAVKTERFTNHLITAKSPYLLQHAHHPVDWYPWGEEAFERARAEDKPVFLSIGYATCHWCHVMAHESFESEEVASLLNRYFISVKVDREERPDVDHVYMSACQALTGHGGWPLSIFMTPEGKPFFAGTYFPRTGRPGVRGFVDVLEQIAALWRRERSRLSEAGERIADALQDHALRPAEACELGLHTLSEGYYQLASSFDSSWGGFGGAPKFPSPHHLTFLLRWFKRSGDAQALAMVEKTLRSMRAGGIFDQLGGGFHRYSVDERWLVPHFEKMLYDQALTALAYLETFQVTQEAYYAHVAREVFGYVLRELTGPHGGFYSAEDADSEGMEGKFYLWTPQEIIAEAGREAGELFCRYYGVSEEGNFEHGASILHAVGALEEFADREGMSVEALEAQLAAVRSRLFEVRTGRVRPLVDDKILTGWNGLMIAALSKGAQALGEREWEQAGRRAADFVLSELRGSDGKLFRRYRDGDKAFSAYVEDYAFLCWGLIELYEACFDLRYLEEAIALTREMIECFWDEAYGGLFFSGKENEPLIAQTKDVYDGATPSGNSVAALNLLRLSRLSGNHQFEEKAAQLVRTFAAQIAAYPMAYCHFLNALDFYLGPTQEIVIAGDRREAQTQGMIERVQRRFLPGKVVLLREPGPLEARLAAIAPFTAEMVPVEERPTAYLCELFSCRQPITDVETLVSVMR